MAAPSGLSTPEAFQRFAMSEAIPRASGCHPSGMKGPLPRRASVAPSPLQCGYFTHIFVGANACATPPDRMGCMRPFHPIGGLTVLTPSPKRWLSRRVIALPDVSIWKDL